MVNNEIIKFPKPWIELGSSNEILDNLLQNPRNIHETIVFLPLSKIRRIRFLSDRLPEQVRDGYVQLIEHHEHFQNVKFNVLSQDCQTNALSKNREAQTYPGNPKNKWTDYKFVVPEEFSSIWGNEKNEEVITFKYLILSTFTIN